MNDEVKTRVLVVDDDPDLLAAHSLHLLSLGCDVLTADSGSRALEQVQEAQGDIDIILSDIVMPGMDGYALCQSLKNDEDTCGIPLVFLSQLVSLEEKMKGFEVGADDYLTKPISPEELSFKLSKLIELRSANKKLQKQLRESNNVAMQAMTYSSDLGQILEFYKKALTAADFEEVASLLFDVTNGYALKASLQIRMPNQQLNFGSLGAVSPLEANVIELSHDKGRFFDFGSRTMINHDDFSLLIKNMPTDDPERYGTLKDSLGALCNAVEARVKFLLHQNATKQKEKVVNAVIGMMNDVDGMFTQLQQQNATVISDMLNKIDDAMLDLGLTEMQEDLIREIIVAGREELDESFKSNDKMYDKFEQVRNELDNALSRK